MNLIEIHSSINYQNNVKYHNNLSNYWMLSIHHYHFQDAMNQYMLN